MSAARDLGERPARPARALWRPSCHCGVVLWLRRNLQNFDVSALGVFCKLLRKDGIETEELPEKANSSAMPLQSVESSESIPYILS